VSEGSLLQCQTDSGVDSRPDSNKVNVSQDRQIDPKTVTRNLEKFTSVPAFRILAAGSAISADEINLTCPRRRGRPIIALILVTTI
jgi:hypothetical protein